jgi:hypothetical protein
MIRSWLQRRAKRRQVKRIMERWQRGELEIVEAGKRINEIWGVRLADEDVPAAQPVPEESDG